MSNSVGGTAARTIKAMMTISKAYQQGKREGLMAEYKHYAKLADDRLRQIERLSRQEGFENVKNFAYAKAQKDIAKWNKNTSKPGSNRWRTKAPESNRALEAKLADIKDFLSKETSSRKGIIESIKKSTDSLNKHYGTNFTWKEMSTFWTSEVSEKLDRMMGSDTLIRTIAAVKKLTKSKEKNVENYKKAQFSTNVKEINKKIIMAADNNTIVAEKAKALMKSGVGYSDLFTRDGFSDAYAELDF